MRRKITIALLALGTIAGFTSGIASLRCRAQWRRAAFERHVAALCVQAAREADAGGLGAPRGRAAPPAWNADSAPPGP
jgi:hypothetical protein